MFHTLFLENKTDMADFCFFRKPRCLFRQLKGYFSNTARFWANSSRFFPHRFLFFRLAKCGTLIFFFSMSLEKHAAVVYFRGTPCAESVQDSRIMRNFLNLSEYSQLLPSSVPWAQDGQESKQSWRKVVENCGRVRQVQEPSSSFFVVWKC